MNTTTLEYNQMIVGYKGDYKHNINEFELTWYNLQDSGLFWQLFTGFWRIEVTDLFLPYIIWLTPACNWSLAVNISVVSV